MPRFLIHFTALLCFVLSIAGAQTATDPWSTVPASASTQEPVTSPVPVDPGTFLPAIPQDPSAPNGLTNIAYTGLVWTRTNHSITNGTAPLAGPTLQWLPCPQTSPDSYVNFTFNPYPLRRGQSANVSLNGWITEDISVGTTLEMKSRLASFPIIRGPSFKLDLCDFIASKFENSPRPIRCPIKDWAVPLILNSIAQKSDSGSVGMQVKVPRILIPGNYKTTVELKTKSNDVVTCATTLIQIK